MGAGLERLSRLPARHAHQQRPTLSGVGKVLLGVAAVGLTIYALFDVVSSPRRVVPVLPKWLWLLAVLVPVVGPAAWLVVSRRARSPLPEHRVTGPDDDPDFLSRLRPQRPGPTDDSVRRWEDELRGDPGSDR